MQVKSTQMKDPAFKVKTPHTSGETEDVDDHQVSQPVNTILEVLKKNFLVKDFEGFFRILCYFIMGVFIFFINDVILFRNYCEKHGIYTIPWSYNLLSIAVVFCLFGFKKVLKATLTDVILENLNDKYVGPQRLIRSKKILKWTQDTIYYSTTTVKYQKPIYCIFYLEPRKDFFLIAFRNEVFMPSALGGSGECSGMLNNYPNFPESNVVLFYHLVQFGHHTYSFFELVIFRRNEDSKFYEFTLHHFMAAGLIFYSGLFNLMYSSVLVLIIHDMGDIFVAGGRAYADMKFKNKYVLYTIMVSALIVWIGSRIFLFPVCVIYTAYDLMGDTTQGVWLLAKNTYYYMLIQVVILFFLHCYWTLFMLKIVLDYLFKPVYKNHYDDNDFNKLNKKANEEKTE